MHLAGARAAWVTILTLLMVSVLSAIDIIFGRLEGASTTAGALRAALPYLILTLLMVSYLLFEAKVVELLFHLADADRQLQWNWDYARPPMSFVGTFSSPGSSVGRGLSSEEAVAGGRDAASPAFESGYTEPESGHVADPSPASFSGGYSRRRSPTRTPASRRSSSSSEASNLTSNQDDVEDDASSTTLQTREPDRYVRFARIVYGAIQDEADDERSSPRTRRGTKSKR